MYSGLGIGFLLLVVGQLCSSASISKPTEVPVPSYKQIVERFRKVFLDFPCSNKMIVNQLFDVCSKFGDLDQDEHVYTNAVIEMKRLVVIGSGLNVSPAAWKTALQNYESRGEPNLDSLVTELKLTPAQIERLHIIFPTDRPYGELQLYKDNFPIGVALGINELDIKRILDHHQRTFVDYDTEFGAMSKQVAEELGDFAEETCERDLLHPGRYIRKANIVRDFMEALDAIKIDDSDE